MPHFKPGLYLVIPDDYYYLWNLEALDQVISNAHTNNTRWFHTDPPVKCLMETVRTMHDDCLKYQKSSFWLTFNPAFMHCFDNQAFDNSRDNVLLLSKPNDKGEATLQDLFFDKDYFSQFSLVDLYLSGKLKI